MRGMSNASGETQLDDEARLRIQKWLWNSVENGWNPRDAASPYWHHEDNQAAQQLGWMILNLPGCEYCDLFSLKPGVLASKMMQNIVKASGVDPLCAKAVGVLTGMKLKYPDVRFAFDVQNDKGGRGSRR